MIKEFEKYQGVNVLNFFLENPDLDIHIKELSRRLKISPATSKKFCNLFNKENMLTSEKKGNSIFFRLNNFDNYVKLLKKTYAITKIKENWKKASVEDLKSVVIYGSYASGEYSNNSDIDILLITRKKDINHSFILKFQKKIKKEVNVTKMTYIEWQKLKQKKDPFVKEVLENNFVIQGEKI